MPTIAQKTQSTKDKSRLLQFIEAGALDLERLQEILGRHGLDGAWQQFERQFLE